MGTVQKKWGISIKAFPLLKVNGSTLFSDIKIITEWAMLAYRWNGWGPDLVPTTFVNNESSVLVCDNLLRMHTHWLQESSEGPGGTASPRNGSVECGVVTPIGFPSMWEARAC